MRGLSPEAERVLKYLHKYGIADKNRIMSALSMTANEVAGALDELEVTGHAGMSDTAFRPTSLGQQYAANLTMELPNAPPKDPRELTEWMARSLYEINARTAENAVKIGSLHRLVDVHLDDLQKKLDSVESATRVLEKIVLGNGNPDEGLLSRSKRTATYIPVLFGALIIVSIISIVSIFLVVYIGVM